jgi:hypothetical protein
MRRAENKEEGSFLKKRTKKLFPVGQCRRHCPRRGIGRSEKPEKSLFASFSSEKEESCSAFYSKARR